MNKYFKRLGCDTLSGGSGERCNNSAPIGAVAVGLATILLVSCGSSDKPEDEMPEGEKPEGGLISGPLDAPEVRDFIESQVGQGGLLTLMVPKDNSEIPQPLLDNGEVDPDFETTEAKRYLGKHLYHDPVRTVRITPEFDGEIEFTSSASCGSCHFGEAGSKAGQTFNFAVGGEGFGYTNAEGEFVVRRRARTDILPRLRDVPLYEGDDLVDALPTLTDVYTNAIGSPSLQQLPDTGTLVSTGRLDGVDSVSRMSPSVIGFAFNNRLLLDGFAGEDNDSDGGLNPFDHSAQENLTLLLLDAHRMFSLDGPQGARIQAEALLDFPPYEKLFRDAFPEKAALADEAGDIKLLVRDETVLRATASFLRTVVTRNTPWDKFLEGDDDAMTQTQLRGAELFFTDANEGGAGCYGCHSGPMLNKQPEDTDVAGVGDLVEENFYNLGLRDHPLHALVRDITGDPNNRDVGRAEINGNEDDKFKFRSLTLRQLRDGGNFMHNASFKSVREVVEYFNDGIPQDNEAGLTATERFTYPRGENSERGLGLSEADVLALTEFLENGLYDPAFVEYDPDSTTDTLKLNEKDLTYSVYRPDLAELGAVDGFVFSGRGQDNDDPLSRRDQGMEFATVTLDLDATRVERSEAAMSQDDLMRFSNNTNRPIDTHLLVVVENLPTDVTLVNASGTGSNGDPYIRVFLDDDAGTLQPGKMVDVQLSFDRPDDTAVEYDLVLLSGQGTP